MKLLQEWGAYQQEVFKFFLPKNEQIKNNTRRDIERDQLQFSLSALGSWKSREIERNSVTDSEVLSYQVDLANWKRDCCRVVVHVIVKSVWWKYKIQWDTVNIQYTIICQSMKIAVWELPFDLVYCLTK